MKLILFLCMALAFPAFAEIQIQLDKDRVESGSSFGLRLIVPLQQLPEVRNVPVLHLQNGFSLLGIDSTDQVMRPSAEDLFNSFFRASSRSSYKARIYTFKLQAPKKTGSVNAGSLVWNIDGQDKVIAEKLPVPLQRAYTDAALTVSLTPSKRTVYEGEQFYVTLGFHAYEHFAGNLVAQQLDLGNDFLAHRSELDDLKFERIAGTREMEASSKFAWLSATHSGDMSIAPFKFKYTKVGEPKVVEETKTVGGMTFKSSSITNATEEAEAASLPIKIKVLPLPAGAPDNFSGMVGNYTFSAEFDKDTLKIGDALTLSINIKGDGKPGTITDPKLPDFSEFRAVPPESKISKKIVGGRVITSKEIKTFLYPKRKGSFEIPEISYTWFNPSKKKYETATMGPWVIEVEKGELQGTQGVSFTSFETSPLKKKEIEILGKDIRFIKNVPVETFTKPLYKNIFYWIALFLTVPFYMVFVGYMRYKRKRAGNALLMRKSKASKNFRIAMDNAEHALKNSDFREFYANIENALTGYLSDNTNLEFRGMVRFTRIDALKNMGLNDAIIKEIDAWYEKCSIARFAPSVNSDSAASDFIAFKKFVETLKIKRT